jgi:hypothetical protein
MKDFGPIIVIEDPFIRSYLRFLLSRHGYSMVDSDASRASRLLDSNGGALVITNKPEPLVPFAHKLALIYLATAPDMDLASQFPACRVIRKPFQPEELVQAIEGLIPPE